MKLPFEILKLLQSPAVREAIRRLNPRLLAKLVQPPGRLAVATFRHLLQDRHLRQVFMREAKRLGLALWRRRWFIR